MIVFEFLTTTDKKLLKKRKNKTLFVKVYWRRILNYLVGRHPFKVQSLVPSDRVRTILTKYESLDPRLRAIRCKLTGITSTL